MPRWEVCEIVEQWHETRPGGMWTGPEGKSRWEARLYTPGGEFAVIAHSSGWSNTDGDHLRSAQLLGLVARVAADGCEPIPLGDVGHSRWYFKRQLSDA